MKPNLKILSRYTIPIIANLESNKQITKIPFKFDHVIRFRHKFDSRSNILNQILPNEFKLSDRMLFYSLYYDKDIKLLYKDSHNYVTINQNRISELGSNLLILRIYNYLLINRNDFQPINLIDIINPLKINTLKIRHDFINQFNQLLDSKNLLHKSIKGSTIKTIKIEKNSRHKVLPMLIGLIHCQYGIQKSTKFIDEWVLRGKWSTIENYNHKGMIEIYTDKKLKVF
jgi:hypothetical protein